MAISDDGKRGQIGPSLRGLIYQYERDGVWVTSKWPKKRGKKATPRQKLAQEAFKQAMLAMKLTAPAIQLFHRIAAKGTPMLPRDSLMAALYGNGPTIHTYSGKVIKPMANRILSSTVLDALGSDPGTILYRGPEIWEVLPPGLNGQVISYSEAEKRPVWIEPPGGGVADPKIWTAWGSFTASNYNITGNVYQFELDVSLAAVEWVSQITSGYVQRIGVAFLGQTNLVTAIPYPQRVVAISPGGLFRYRHVLDAPVNIPAGQRFWIFVQYSETTGVVSNGLYTADAYFANFAIGRGIRRSSLMVENIAIGTNAGSGTEGAFAIDPEFT